MNNSAEKSKKGAQKELTGLDILEDTTLNNTKLLSTPTKTASIAKNKSSSRISDSNNNNNESKTAEKTTPKTPIIINDSNEDPNEHNNYNSSKTTNPTIDLTEDRETTEATDDKQLTKSTPSPSKRVQHQSITRFITKGPKINSPNKTYTATMTPQLVKRTIVEYNKRVSQNREKNHTR